MCRTARAFISLAILIFGFKNLPASAEPAPPIPPVPTRTHTAPNTLSAPVKVSTLNPADIKNTQILLFEPATGRILIASNPDRQSFPASLTKMMTAYLTFDAIANGHLTLESPLQMSEYARLQPATRVGLRKGIDVTINQAVRALIIRSANDFAVALAETVAGSESAFITRMNQTARRLGMSRTNFTNPHGLPNPHQVSTARDMALLTSALLRDFPHHADVFSNPEVSIRKLTLRSHNTLLKTYQGADGLKTGFTCASGYNIVASATRNGRKVVAVIIGALRRAKRDHLAAQLLDYGFYELEQDKTPSNQTLASLPFTGNESDDTLNLSHKTKTWVCGNASKPRRARSKKHRSKKKKRKRKSKKKKKKKK